MKHIVILGGGFAGVTACLDLIKHKIPDTRITLIDKNPFHIYTPALYEVATSEEPEKNISIPFKEIFDRKVNLVQNAVKSIDTSKQIVVLEDNKEVAYDYLIVALGSEAAYFGIEGLKEFSIPLKSLEDATLIKNKIKELCCEEGKCNRKVNLIIGGGGFTGTELAGEMLTYKDRLAKEHKLDKDCLRVFIIQRSDKLLKELDSHVSKLAQKRVASPDTTFCFGGHITKVTDKEVFTDDGKVYPYHIFIWTGGVAASHIAADSNLPITKGGQIIVNEFLQVQGLQNVYAAGDIAGYVEPKTQQLAPGVCQVAEDEGKTAAENIYRSITGKPLEKYHYRHWGYIVPLRGRFSAAELLGWMHIDGFFAWVLQQLTVFYYLLHILPFFQAFKKWSDFEFALLKSHK